MEKTHRSEKWRFFRFSLLQLSHRKATRRQRLDPQDMGAEYRNVPGADIRTDSSRIFRGAKMMVSTATGKGGHSERVKGGYAWDNCTTRWCNSYYGGVGAKLP